MTRQFGVDEVDARNAVQSLPRSPARIVEATAGVLLDAYDISARKNHNVYDGFLLAMAQAHEADYLVTTDQDFTRLCQDESVAYRNPVLAEKRDRLSTTEEKSPRQCCC